MLLTMLILVLIILGCLIPFLEVFFCSILFHTP